MQTTSPLNGDAAPFIPISPSEGGDNATQIYGTFKLKVPLNSKVWQCISASHSHRIIAARKSNIQRVVKTNIIPEMHLNLSLVAEASPEGLISVRRKDKIL